MAFVNSIDSLRACQSLLRGVAKVSGPVSASPRRGRSFSGMSHRAIVAATFGPPEVMKSTIVPALAPPRKGQVLLKMYAAGVNPSDTYIRLGPAGPWAATPHLLPGLPYTPGKDGAGVVEAVGEGVTAFAPGNRVYTSASLSGTFAEYALCSAESVHPLPDRVSFAQGACVGVPCATAYRALFTRCAVAAGDAVFIHGASGAVGLAATQLAVAAGCTVVGSAGTPNGEQMVAKLGATAVNHRAAGYLEAATAALPAGKTGFDVVLEMAAHANLVTDLGLLQHGGRLAIIGSKPEPIALNPRLLMPRELSVLGVFMPAASAAEKHATHRALYASMERGELTPVVGAIFALDDAPSAHREIVAPTAGGKVGNIVVLVRSESSDF